MREWTNKILDAIEMGLISNEMVVDMCLGWMDESDVKGMVFANDLQDVLGCPEREDEPDVDELTEWQDYDPDC